MSMSYECWSYKSGKPDVMTKVVANNSSEAESIAWEKFRNMGKNPEKVTVK